MADNSGLLLMNYGLLCGIVADFGLLGCPANYVFLADCYACMYGGCQSHIPWLI